MISGAETASHLTEAGMEEFKGFVSSDHRESLGYYDRVALVEVGEFGEWWSNGRGAQEAGLLYPVRSHGEVHRSWLHRSVHPSV